MKKTLLLLSVVILLISCKKETVEVSRPEIITVKTRLFTQPRFNSIPNQPQQCLYLHVNTTHPLRESVTISFKYYNAYWATTIYGGTIQPHMQYRVEKITLPYSEIDTIIHIKDPFIVPTQEIRQGEVTSVSRNDLPYRLKFVH